jgi:hypothetical protein
VEPATVTETVREPTTVTETVREPTTIIKTVSEPTTVTETVTVKEPTTVTETTTVTATICVEATACGGGTPDNTPPDRVTPVSPQECLTTGIRICSIPESVVGYVAVGGKKEVKPWYYWPLLVVGLVLCLVGAVFVGNAVRHRAVRYYGR